jgi:TonB family protein
MKVDWFFLPSRRFLRLGAVCLSIFFLVAAALWCRSLAAQPAVPKLTLAQVEQLVSSHVPDSTMRVQIQSRGLAFTPSAAIVESLRAKGAGPLTLAAIEARVPKGAEAGRRLSPGANGGASQGNLPGREAPQAMLGQARRDIPGILTRIYQSLDEGNPQAARAFLSGDVLSDARQLDGICLPFSYKADYVASIIERPGPVFEARGRTLFKPSSAKAQVFTFQPYMGSFMLLRVENDNFAAEIESAKEAVRQFIFAVRAGRWDVASRYASPGLPLEQMKSPKWEEYFSKITSANASHDGTLTKGGILLLIRVDVRNYSSYLPDFLVDPETGLIVRAFFRSPENLFSQLPDPAGFTDPDLERNEMKRFGQPAEIVNLAGRAAPETITADNGSIRLSVKECRAKAGQVICTGEQTYIGQGVYGTFMNKYSGSMNDDQGGSFRRSDAWFGELSGPRETQIQLSSGIPVHCVWVYEGFTPGSRSLSLTFPNGIVLRDVPLLASVPEAEKPEVEEANPATPRKISISSGIAAGLLLQKTEPIYPPIARAARVQGSVVLQARISKDGTVESLRVVSGPPMLQQAALDAVKSWRYRPYRINDEPVEVETTVSVVFTLGG